MNGDYKANKRDLEEMAGESAPSSNKKAKLDEAEPSKVLHLRNLATNLISAELIALGASFGRVDKHIFIKDRTQALLQLGSIEEAQAMVDHYNANKYQLKGKDVYVQFSRRAEITIKNGVHQADGSVTSTESTSYSPYSTATPAKIEGGENPITTTYNTVIRVILESGNYPLELDFLYKVFSKFGKIIKMVNFIKNNQYGCLIQYTSNKEASMAIATLNQKALFADGSYLRVELSKLNNLEVKEKRGWDLTKDPNLPTTVQQPVAPPQAALTMPYPTLGMFPSFHPLLAAACAASPYGLPPAASAMMSTTPAALVGAQGSPVAIVSNLHEQIITPDALFTLFGVYGNVLRVKILYNKKGTALIQMADPGQVRLAIQYLDRLPLYGLQMRVNESKNTQVHLPRPGDSPEASKLTKDYTTSPLHRFKKPGSKNYQNIFPPSAVLHLSNIPPDCTEETLREALHTVAGVQTIIAFKFLLSDKKMALVQLENVQEAAQALIKLHNHKLSDSNHLRVSFSKAVI